MVVEHKTINHDVLKTLKELDDGVFFAELIKLFLENVPPLFLAIREAISRHDLNSLYVAAHKLKGSCGNVGAEHMAELARALESKGRAPMRPGASARPAVVLAAPSELKEPLTVLALLEEEFASVTALLSEEVRVQLARFSATRGAAPARLH